MTPLVVGLEADQSDILAVADALPQGRERRPGVVVGPQVLSVASVEVHLLEGGVVGTCLAYARRLEVLAALLGRLQQVLGRPQFTVVLRDRGVEPRRRPAAYVSSTLPVTADGSAPAT